MKTALLLLAALLTAACASKDGFIDDSTRQCAPGDPVTIEAGVEVETPEYGDRATRERLMIRVRVTNLTDDEIEVRTIRTEQSSDSSSYRIDSAYKKFDEAIAEGEDHVFEIPSYGERIASARSDVRNQRVVMSVMVELANGDVYHCRYAV